jgi:menaquinone-dependent protoporphyrinogen IX oxidase
MAKKVRARHSRSGKHPRFRKARGRRAIHHIDLKKLKCLVVYFSRTGNTKKLAEAISIVFRCDIDEIREARDRNGILGLLRSGNEAMSKQMVEIEVSKKPEKYDMIIVGTPVWAGNLSSPVRSYLHKYKKDFNKVAFFCTCGSNPGKTFQEMHTACGKKPVAILSLSSADVVKGGYIQKLSEFLDEIYR